MAAALDALKVFATVEKAALRWKGHRGPSAAATDQDSSEDALKNRRRAFLIRAARAEQHEQELLEKRKFAAAQVRKALKEKATQLVINRPLRRFGMKMQVHLVYHKYNAETKSEVITRHMVVMQDDIKYESLDEWARTCLGLPKLAKKEASSSALKYEYVSLNGHPTVVDGKAALQQWLDAMWAVHPPVLHAFDNDGLLAEALDQTSSIRKVFDEYDGDGNGEISLVEMTNMIIEMDLQNLGVTKDEVAQYVSDEFERVDKDKSGDISFDEFCEYYANLQGFLKDKLSVESKHTHMYTKFREEHMEARSLQLTLGELADGCKEEADAPESAGAGLNAARALTVPPPRVTTVLDPISGDPTARMGLEAHGHRFGVEVLVPKASVGEAQRAHVIRAETVIQAQVDYFADGTGGLGQPLSPTVYVEVESSEGKKASLGGDITVVLPTCLGSMMDDKSVIAKGDLAVCFGRWQTGEWLEIDETHFELLPPRPMPQYGCEMPLIAVRLPTPGLVCAFSRHDNRKPRMRVRCAAYLPGRMSHLELHRLRVYVSPAIPDELESLTVREQHDRGSVSLSGVSEIFELSYGERLAISVSLPRKGEGGGGAAPAGSTMSGALNWMGDVTYVDLDFDPEEMHTSLRAAAAEKEGGGEGEEGAGSVGNVHGNLEVKVEVEDLRSRLRAAGRRGAFSGLGGGGGGGSAERTQVFPCAVTIVNFSPPAAPTKLSLVHRTNASLSVAFEPPKRWGGCALDRHEVEMREITKDGKYHEKGWAAAQEIPAGRPPVTQIAARVWKAELRVRSWNIACETPSEWSEIFEIGEPQDKKAGPGTLDKAGVSKTDVIAAAKAQEATALKRGKSSVEAGVATVIQRGIDEQFMVPHVSSGAEFMEAHSWSPLRRAIGEFFVEVGVFGGCQGRLFDFAAEDVEDLVNLGDDPGLDASKPLLSLAMIGCYVLQTLAQHAVINAEAWIPMANEIMMMASLARKTAENDETRPMVRSLLAGLIEVYESLVQCDEDGYIARQLNAKYERGLKQLLRDDWAEQMARLKNRIASDMMGLVLYERLKAHQK